MKHVILYVEIINSDFTFFIFQGVFFLKILFPTLIKSSIGAPFGQLSSLSGTIGNGKIITYDNVIAKNRLKVDLKIKLLNNVALYNLIISPADKKNDKTTEVENEKQDFQWYEKLVSGKDSYKYINIKLSDKDGFHLFEEKQNIQKSYTRIVDSNGEIDGFQYEGHFDIPPMLSAISTNLSITYNL